MEKIKLAIIGYGAMSELFHLPAAILSDLVDVVGLFDINEGRIIETAKQFNIPFYGADFMKHIDEFDAAVVATPNLFHSDISIELLKHGKHVLVEKPMAISYIDCQNMIGISQKENRIISIGHVRRLYDKNIFIKKLIAKNILGEIYSIEISEGNAFEWPMASKSFIDKEVSGGGVLIDLGVHLIDLLFWWFGELQLVAYYDDSQGGIEADCTIKLSSKISPEIHVEISRLRKLNNEIRIHSQRGILCLSTGFDSGINYTISRNSEFLFSGVINSNSSTIEFSELIKKQLNNFIRSIYLNKIDEEAVSSAMESVKLIEKCYKNRKQICYNWEDLNV